MTISVLGNLCHKQTVIDLRCQGYTYQSIYDIITAKGYTGSLAALRIFMQKERKHARTQGAAGFRTIDFVQRKSLCQLIYKKLEDIPAFNQEQYEEAVRRYPVLGQLYAALKEFYKIMFSKNLKNSENGWKTWKNGYSGNFIVYGRNEKRYYSSTK